MRAARRWASESWNLVRARPWVGVRVEAFDTLPLVLGPVGPLRLWAMPRSARASRQVWDL